MFIYKIFDGRDSHFKWVIAHEYSQHTPLEMAVRALRREPDWNMLEPVAMAWEGSPAFTELVNEADNRLVNANWL